MALIDADDRHHAALLAAYEEDPDAWILPWAILPEVDYLLLEHVGEAAEFDFAQDVAEARYTVDWGASADLPRAAAILKRYRKLRLGLVDALVMAIAERLRARAIATLDLRHFGAVRIEGTPKLIPRDP